MAVNYTYVVRLAKVSEKELGRRVYATAQSKETVTTRDIAEHIASHNSVFSEGTIIGLLQDAQKCIMEQLVAGKRVDLDDLGSFYTTIASRGARSAEEFDLSLIKSVNLRWNPSKRMKRAIKGVELTLVATRAEQQRVMKQMSEEANKEVTGEEDQ